LSKSMNTATRVLRFSVVMFIDSRASECAP
jgi:hypothetical protein